MPIMGVHGDSTRIVQRPNLLFGQWPLLVFPALDINLLHCSELKTRLPAWGLLGIPDTVYELTQLIYFLCVLFCQIFGFKGILGQVV